MAKHVFFQYGYNGFFNGNSNNIIGGFGNQDYEDVELNQNNSPYLNSCLYRKYVGTSNMKTIPGIIRSISRVVFAKKQEFYKIHKGIGGFAFDGATIYMDYYDGTVNEFKNEKDHSKNRHIIMKLSERKKINAFCVDEYGNKKPYLIQTHSKQADAHSASAIISIIAALIHELPKTAEEMVISGHIQDCIDKYSDYKSPEFAEAVFCAANDLYTYIAYADKLPLQSIPVNDLSNAIIPSNLNLDKLPVFDVMYGDSAYINNEQKTTPSISQVTKKPLTVKEIIESEDFKLDSKRVLTPEEELMIPSMDDLIPDPLIIKAAKLLKGSTYLPKPFRNIKWVGETGTGKSTASQILAQMLHLPYTFMTFNPDTIISDLYVNILPSNKPKSTLKNSEIGSILEKAVFSPDEAYTMLTGKDKKGATTTDVISKIITDVIETSSDFMYVESPLVQAFKNGWVVELQETNLVAKPGVLGGINAALDDLGIIKLPTGDIVKRHPDCVVIMTQNESYEGTRKSNQAVDSRMTIKGVFELPDEDELAQRISRNSGLKDMTIIRKMIKVMNAIRKVRLENGETDGACSVREVQSWAQATEILQDPYEAALSTIVPSATHDEELVPEIMAQLETQFAPKDIPF